MKLPMFIKLLPCTAILVPLVAYANACVPPEFETFVTRIDNAFLSDAVEIEMQPVATLRIPSGFTKVGAMMDGSLGFGRHPKNVSVVLGFETSSTMSIHGDDIKPGHFFLSIFKGLNINGCKHLKSLQLENEHYRLHGIVSESAELFAYGKVDEHHFYLVRPEKPDVVLNGFFRNISRKEFEKILSTLNIE